MSPEVHRENKEDSVHPEQKKKNNEQPSGCNQGI